MDQWKTATCPSCGAAVPQHASFCSKCGNKMPKLLHCQNCGALIPEGYVFCQQCGTPVERQNPTDAPIHAEGAPAPVPDSAADMTAGIAPAPAVNDTAAASPAEQVYAQQTEQSPAEQDYAYAQRPAQTQASVQQAASIPSPPYAPVSPSSPPYPPVPAPKVKSKSVVSKIIAAAAAVAVIGGTAAAIYFYHPGAGLSVAYIKENEIYYTGLSKIEPVQMTDTLFQNSDADPNDLTYEVSRSKDGRYLFYPDKLESSDDGYALYFKDVTDKKVKEGTKIAGGVSGYQINEAGTAVFYLTTDGDLYTYNLKDKNKVDKEVSDYYINKDGTRLVYVTDDGALYQQDLGGKKDKEKIGGDVTLENVSEDLGYLFYTKDTFLYRKAFDKSEEKIASDINKYVASSDDGSVYYTKGEDSKVSLSDYVTDDMADTDANITEPSYSDYETEVPYTLYGYTYYYTETDYDAYNKAYETYSEKLTRDALRDDLRSQTVNVPNASLYFYDTGENKISDNFDTTGDYGTKTPVIVYSIFAKSDVSKVKLSEITSVSDIETKVQDALTSSAEIHLAVKSKDTKLDQTDSEQYYINYSGTECYFLDDYSSDDDSGTLMEVKIDNGGPSGPTKVDDNVYSLNFLYKSDTLLYIKNFSNRSGDLYVDKTKADSDVSVYSFSALEGSSAMAYLTDYDETDETGTLKLFNGKESVKVADDVNSFSLLDKSHIAYISGYDTDDKTGDAYYYDGSSKPKQIDTGVSYIFEVKNAY